MPTIVLGDGHPLFVDLMRSVLAESGYEVLGVATTSDAVAAEVRDHRPEVCLVDHVSLAESGESTALLAELVAAGRPDARVVAITADPDPAGVAEARSVGVVGYLGKNRTLVAVLGALTEIRGGGVVVDARPRRPPRRVRSEAHRLAEALTARERECLALLVDGSTTSRMVEELGISVMTVRSHVQSILHKLGVHSRLEAASLAVRYDLLGADGEQTG